MNGDNNGKENSVPWFLCRRERKRVNIFTASENFLLFSIIVFVFSKREEKL